MENQNLNSRSSVSKLESLYQRSMQHYLSPLPTHLLIGKILKDIQTEKKEKREWTSEKLDDMDGGGELSNYFM